MLRIIRRFRTALLLLLLPACGGLARGCAAPAPLDRAAMAALHAAPDAPPAGPLRVYHLGHSLVGLDMPAMLAQLAPEGHDYRLQQGWGTSLKQHWEDGTAIPGLAGENPAAVWHAARAAVASGEYDAFVMTESVEIRDAIRWGDSWDYAARFARAAREANPATRVYLYETWHLLTDREGWLERLDRDLDRYWEGEILRRVQATPGIDRPVRVIPAGQVFARFVRAVEAMPDGIDGIRGRADLFALTPEGTQDPIHINDLGKYLVALTHYAVLYGRSPVGLPRALRRADGTPATAPGPAAARLMQETVREVVTGYSRTGVAALD